MCSQTISILYHYQRACISAFVRAYVRMCIRFYCTCECGLCHVISDNGCVPISALHVFFPMSVTHVVTYVIIIILPTW